MVTVVVMLVLAAASAYAFADAFSEGEYTEGMMWIGASVVLLVLALIAFVYGG